ncbi:MAG TPA: DUF4397 domain-containing protein [Gemmatimonadaceae bacterium]|jgi:hypothetical protein|nr:DUF4397 domain-containing protein [Gemmatimonadaceae bacterium]
MRNRLVTFAAGTLLAAGLLGCEGQASGHLIGGPSGGARVRVFNAVTSAASINFLVDGQVAASNVAFGSPSEYAPVSVGSHRLEVQATGTGTTLLDFTRDFAAEGSFSLVPAPGLSQSGALLIADDPTPVTGQGRFRVVHVAAVPGPVSVYVTAPDVELASATPAVPSLDFAAVSQYISVLPGAYRVRITSAGNPGDVLLDTGGVVVGSGSVHSLFLTDSPGGGLPTQLSIVSDAT